MNGEPCRKISAIVENQNHPQTKKLQHTYAIVVDFGRHIVCVEQSDFSFSFLTFALLAVPFLLVYRVTGAGRENPILYSLQAKHIHERSGRTVGLEVGYSGVQPAQGLRGALSMRGVQKGWSAGIWPSQVKSSLYSPKAKRHHPHRFWVGFGVMGPPEHVWLG